MTYTLYKITNLISTREYVGVTNNFDRRMYEHKNGVTNKDLAKDIEKLGINSFSFQPICTGPKDYILLCEYNYLNEFLHKTNMYNKNTGGSLNGGTFGENHGSAKVTDEIVAKIRLMYSEGCYTYYQLSDIFGITASSIGKIVRGTTWKHNSSNLELNNIKTSARYGIPRDKVTPDIVKFIRDSYATGRYTYIDIANMLSNTISKTAVGKIVRRERWNNVH